MLTTTPDPGQMESEVPPWSGVPLQVSEGLLLVPLHVSDTRSVQLPNWLHAGFFESLGGDIEYHLYRDPRVSIPPLLVPVTD